MNVIFIIALFIAGSSALPDIKLQNDLKNQRLVTDAIASAIQDLSQSVRDAGLDPLYIASDQQYYELPVPVIFNYATDIEELLFTGLSNIVINNLSFGILTYRLRFDIELPLIEATLNKATADVIIFGEQYSAAAAGRLAIKKVRVNGEIRVSVGIISGISIRNISINFSLGSIESALSVGVQSWDLSNYLNTLLGVKIPTTLNKFSSEINELLEIIVLEIANEIL